MSRPDVPPDGTLVQITFTATVWGSDQKNLFFIHNKAPWLVPAEVIDSIEVVDERQQLRQFLAGKAWADDEIDNFISIFDLPDCPVVLEPRPRPESES